MKVTSLLAILFSFTSFASNYSDGPYVGEMINSCVPQYAISSDSIEKTLKTRYPKHSDREVSIYGVEIKSPRYDLLELLVELVDSESLDSSGLKGCESILCISDKLFGKGLGAYYLYILDEFNINLSHLSNEYDSSGEKRFKDIDLYTKAELNAIITALKLLPKDSLKSLEFGQPMKRINQSKGSTLANATVSFFNLWGHSKHDDKVTTVIHEIGHVLGDIIAVDEKNRIDQSSEWAQFSNWTWNREEYFAVYNAQYDWYKNNFVSDYARSNPVEDFAESFTSYILNSSHLKYMAPGKFEFMKREVFNGVEYSKYFCESLNLDNSISDNLVDYKSINYEKLASNCLSDFTKTLVNLDQSQYLQCLAGELLERKNISIDYNSDRLKREITKHPFYKLSLEATVNLILDEMNEYDGVLPGYYSPLKINDERYGEFGYSMEISTINNELTRWTFRALEINGLEKTHENIRKTLKRILIQRAM